MQTRWRRTGSRPSHQRSSSVSRNQTELLRTLEAENRKLRETAAELLLRNQTLRQALWERDARG